MTTFTEYSCPECGADKMSQTDFRIHLVQKHPTIWLAKRAAKELERSLREEKSAQTQPT
jgi:hypothetical protein